MQLFDLIRNKKVLAEGGNVSSTSPGWQGAADQEAEEIDLKIHNRDFMVGQLRTLLAAQNESFKAAYGKYIWDPKLLASGKMFSGSSLQFFDVKGVNTQDFVNKLKKTKVGDIDTQIDQDMGDEVTAWLKSIIGKKVGNGTFLGFNSSLSSIWLLDDPQVRIQVDYELGPYDAETKSPTEWFAYSHSSHYDDMAAGIKGVFHKYLNRALTHAQASEKYVARVLKKGVKISDAPVTDSDYSFAVTSSQGGGMSVKYKPYIDPATGQPMEKDGIPVMQLLEPKDRDYIQNLDQQFQMTYGRKRGEADKNLQGSFVGTLQLMNKAFSPEQNESVARAFLDILFGPGAQMITKGDPARDRDIKFAAVDAMLLGGGGVNPLNLSNGQGIRQTAVKMAMDYADKFNAKRGSAPTTEVAEDAAAEIAAKPNYARQGIKHIYNRLPDGRVSSAEMKDAEFIELCKEIAENGGNLNGIGINLKVDGAGIRFGKDQSGRPFFMTSKVTTPLYQDDVGYFTNFGQERGQDEEQLARTENYDNALALITGSKFIQALPSDTIVQAEMLYNPMAEKTDQGLKFVNIPYDPAKLGGEMTLVPFMFKQFSTGEERPDADRIKKRLLAASNNKVKIISNQLEQKGINVSKIIQPVLNLDPANKKANKEILDQARQQLSDAIYNSPKLQGKDALGDNAEGIVIDMPSGQLVKVTSPQMKSAMTAKMAQAGATRQGPAKTAVVAIGSFAGHRGHEELFNYTINKAKELGGDPYLFIGNAEGKDDPIPTAVKVQTWHKLYPQYANNIGTVMQGGSIMQKIKHELINPQPGKPPKYDNVVIMVGEDRADMPIAAALMKAVNKFPGYEHVKVSLEVTPRGTGMSFTKLRNILKDPNATPEQQYAVWAQGFNEKKLGKDWVLQLMDISRKGMGVTAQPAATEPAQQPAPVAEVRLFNSLVRPSLLENKINELDVSKTLNFVKKAHGTQQYGNKPYWNHPKSVAATGKKFFGGAFGPDAIKVALLHDVVEDTPYKLQQLAKMGYTTEVVQAVQLLTKNKALSYAENIKAIIASGNKLAMMVKYADNYQNFTGDKSSWDPTKAENSQKKYLASLDMLGDALGVRKHLSPEPAEVNSTQPATEEFDQEYDDEAGMAQSNLRTMARAVDGLLKTIKSNDNLPEWGQEKIAKAEMMLVSVWDYLQSQKELGKDPKVNEGRALARLKQIVAELSNEKLGQYKKAAGASAGAADTAGDFKTGNKRFSGIVKATKKQFANDEKKVAELFDPGKDWKWSFKGSKEAVAVFYIGEIPYQFYAAGDNGEWEVSFKNAQRGGHRGTKFGLTGTGNSAEVMSTVTDIMRAFLKEYQGKITDLIFTADEPSRQALYARMAKRLLPDWKMTQNDKHLTLSAPNVDQQGVAEGFFDKFKKKKEVELSRDPIDEKERALISKYFPQNNGGMKFGNDQYVLPDGVRATYGVGILTFYKRGGQLKVSVAWHHNERDASNPKATPMTHIDYDINSEQDLAKAKAALDTANMKEGVMSKLANKVMGAAPTQPKYQVGQRVKYETSLHQPDWKDGGQGVGVITDYKNGHYMINGKPVNHFEIKGVVEQGVAEKMLPKSAFAGSDKHKLGATAHAKGKQKGPVKKGQFVGGMEEAKKKGADGKACWKGYRYAGTENGKDKCVPVSEDVENIMGTLIENILRK